MATSKLFVKLVVHDTIIAAISKGGQQAPQLRLVMEALVESLVALRATVSEADQPLLARTLQEVHDIAGALKELLNPSNSSVGMTLVDRLSTSKSQNPVLVCTAMKQNPWWKKLQLDFARSHVATKTFMPEVVSAIDRLASATDEDVETMLTRYPVWLDSLRPGADEKQEQAAEATDHLLQKQDAFCANMQWCALCCLCCSLEARKLFCLFASLLREALSYLESWNRAVFAVVVTSLCMWAFASSMLLSVNLVAGATAQFEEMVKARLRSLKEELGDHDEQGWAALGVLVGQANAFEGTKDEGLGREVSLGAAVAKAGVQIRTLQQATQILLQDLQNHTLSEEHMATWQKAWAEAPDSELPDELNDLLLQLPVSILDTLITRVPEQSLEQGAVHVALCDVGKRACQV